MIPILYEANIKTFTNNGLGALSGALSCEVREERNGAYELTLIYDVSAPHFEDLAEHRLIYAVPSDGADPQPFRIYRISRVIDGRVTVNARHVSYDLNKLPVTPFTAGSVAETFVKIPQNTVETCPFTFWTDKDTIASFKNAIPQPTRAILGGQSGSVLDVYGGEYEWDGWTVKLHNERGRDRGVTIEYGKNLTGMEAQTNAENVYVGIVPYWANENTVMMLPEVVVYSEHAEEAPFTELKAVDFSGEWETQPTEEQLRNRAESYIAQNEGWEIKQSLDIDFVPLWQSEEYKGLAVDRVRLCDTVRIYHTALGVTATAKVIETVYDVLAERYKTITVGSAKASLAATIVGQNEAIREGIIETRSVMAQAISRATEAITGGLGGHVRIMYNANNEPEEILIMDTDDIATAQKIWRWNLGGLGYSDTGYEGDFGTAITQNGEIVANYITAGTLNANIIKAGVLSDAGGNFVLNLRTGALTAKKLSVNSTNFKLTEAGVATMTGAKVVDGDIQSIVTGAAVRLKDGEVYLYHDNNIRTGSNLDNFSPKSTIECATDGVDINTGVGRVILSAGTAFGPTPTTGSMVDVCFSGNNKYIRLMCYDLTLDVEELRVKDSNDNQQVGQDYAVTITDAFGDERTLEFTKGILTSVT